MTEFTNPGLPDDQWQRMLDAHRADIDVTEHDPSERNPFRGRPDLVKRHIETAETAFRDICGRAAEHQRQRQRDTATGGSTDNTKPARRSFGVAHR